VFDVVSLLLISTHDTNHAGISGKLFFKVFGIWYLKYQILSKCELLEKVLYKYQIYYRYLVFIWYLFKYLFMSSFYNIGFGFKD